MGSEEDVSADLKRSRGTGRAEGGRGGHARSRSARATPVKCRTLQKRFLSSNPIAPTISPTTCSSAMASQETDESAEKVPVAVASARCPGNLEAEACRGRRTRRDAKACVRVCARVCSSGVERAGAARCARPARRGLRNLDVTVQTVQFEFFLRLRAIERPKTRVDAFKPSDENLETKCDRVYYERTPRTKPPPVWVPLPPACGRLFPSRRREARDDDARRLARRGARGTA